MTKDDYLEEIAAHYSSIVFFQINLNIYIKRISDSKMSKTDEKKIKIKESLIPSFSLAIH